MERVLFDRMASGADSHWWYVARRRILADLIRRNVGPAPGDRILEIGCGTGHNFEMLGRFGKVDGLEVDDAARATAQAALGHPILSAPLPDLRGLPDASWDLICALDVIEHVEEDRASLARMAGLLRPGGAILLTVPAVPWLWSAHDEANHHVRRYTKSTLRAAIAAGGLRVDAIGYFNSLLFPVAAAKRMVGNITGKTGSDDDLPPAPVNALLRGVFALERHLVGRVSMPIGVSLFAIARAPAGASVTSPDTWPSRPVRADPAISATM